ncbi:unnamed protein product [Adineta steineri]|uniref:Uncharacterized protein n=1 Tax=Adineta steineri TaxID=433720 RepID=A0A814MFN6_9BILA|nr:unnamed protein product [Adineta steineri]CAF1079041.1 unnamed protein product [Adineta steineri]
MQIIEWSNKKEKALPHQEDKLYNAIRQLRGFNLKTVLKEVEKEIELKVQDLYDSPDNIITLKHAAKQELKEFQTDRQVEDHIVINCDRIEYVTVPAQTEVRTSIAVKLVHFSGHIVGDDPGSQAFMNFFGPIGGILGSNYIVSAMKGRDYYTETEDLQFDHKVTSITFDKTPADIRLLDRLDYTIDSTDPRRVKVFAYLSWGGSPVVSWDFHMGVTATLEQTVVTREEYKDKVVIPQQRIEKIIKTVTDTEQRLVTVKEAYEEKIHKRTKEEIKKLLIQERINELS